MQPMLERVTLPYCSWSRGRVLTNHILTKVPKAKSQAESMVVAYGAVEAAPVPRPAANRCEREIMSGIFLPALPFAAAQPPRAQQGPDRGREYCPPLSPGARSSNLV